jgi:hypothetical protein
MVGFIFTPRLSYRTEERADMELSVEDYRKVDRGRRWKAEITDLKTSKRYEVKGASCGLPRCFCDAIIVREL